MDSKVYSLYTALVVILLHATLALAQPVQVNTTHSMAQGLLQWHLALPLLSGGPQWWNLLGTRHGVLTNMVSGSGWQLTGRSGGWGEMRLDGTDDFVDLGASPLWDFNDTTFTIALRFRFGGAFGNLVGFRAIGAPSPGTTGGYFIRMDPGGAVTARLMGAGGGNVAQKSTVRTVFTDGQWHSVVVIFRTDTVTAGNNDITLFTDGVVDQGTPSGGGTYQSCSVVFPGCTLRLGTATDPATAVFGGALDDVRIWQRGVSPDEILAYHTQGPPTYGGLLREEPATLGSVAPSGPPGVRRRVTSQ